MATEKLGYKIGSAVAIFLVSFLFAYLPFMVKTFKRNKTLVSLSNCFAGGVFLSAGLIHILPEAIEGWNKMHDHEHEHDDTLTSKRGGAFLEYVNLRHTGNLKHGSEEGEPFPWVTFAVLASFSGLLFIDRVLLPGHHGHGDDHDHGHNHEAKTDKAPTVKASEDYNDISDHGDHFHHIHHSENEHVSTLAPYVMVIAVGVHAIFEGLALGLMKDFGGFIGFFMAIIFHKWAECFAVGISFLKNNVPKLNTIVSLTIFSALTPLGVIIGIVFNDAREDFKAILMAIAGGTFLYIAIAEILSEEFNTKSYIFYRYGAYAIGVSMMIIVWMIEQLVNA